MKLKTVWAWIKHTILQHPSVFILLGIVLINVVYDNLIVPFLPDAPFPHPNPPEKPHSYYWFGKFITIYIIGMIGYLQRLIKKPPTELEINVIIVYFIFDLLGMLSYIYQGWPEPKYRIVIGFFLAIFYLIIYLTCRLRRS